MFWTIVGAILFIELGIPLICGILGSLSDDGSIGCLIGLAILILILILV